MRRLDTRLEGPILLAPDVFGDDRGFFCETYRRSSFMEHGIREEMVQDNHSRSRRGVVRGMHFSIGRGAAKLVRCGRGAIFDVLVDVRRGFCVLSDTADVLYKQDTYYAPGIDQAFKYDDPDVAIAWPLPADELVPSERDLDAPLLRDVADGLPFEYR